MWGESRIRSWIWKNEPCLVQFLCKKLNTFCAKIDTLVLPKNEIPIWSEIQNFEKKIEKKLKIFEKKHIFVSVDTSTVEVHVEMCFFLKTFQLFFDFVLKTFWKFSLNFQLRSSFSHANVTLWTPKVVPKMSYFGPQKLHLAAVAPCFFRAPGHPSPRPPNLNYGTGWALRRRLGVPMIQIGGLGGTWQCKVRGCGGRGGLAPRDSKFGVQIAPPWGGGGQTHFGGSYLLWRLRNQSFLEGCQVSGDFPETNTPACVLCSGQKCATQAHYTS